MNKTKFDVSKMVRTCCEAFEPYVAGRSVEEIKRELGLKTVVKLASNENPLGPSPRAIAAMKNAISKVYYYPDSGSRILREAIAKKFGLGVQNILLGAGSDEIIEIIAKAFISPEDEIIVSEHAFIRYAMAGMLMDSRVVTARMRNFTHNLGVISKEVNKKTKAIFIANPNNPTGTYNTKTEFEEFMKSLISITGGNPPLVIIDEAYYEYARALKDYPDTLSMLESHPNLIILRTFSKIHGLAGLRCGYGFASEEITAYCERIRPPFNINSIAQAACVAALGDASQVKKTNLLIENEKKYLYAQLSRARIAYMPSATNFILVDVTPAHGQEIFERLLRKGIIVRAMDEYNFPYHIRVSIGLPQQNRLFIKNLIEVIGNK